MYTPSSETEEKSFKIHLHTVQAYYIHSWGPGKFMSEGIPFWGQIQYLESQLLIWVQLVPPNSQLSKREKNKWNIENWGSQQIPTEWHSITARQCKFSFMSKTFFCS